MSYDRAKLADALRRLKDNADFGHYVTTLEEYYSDRVQVLLTQPQPDEALRGECRALYNLLRNINNNNGNSTS
jgi:hypothetical protein